MTDDPPLPDGADHDTLRLRFATVSVGTDGAPGTVDGYSLADADQAPSPTLLAALTCT